MARSSLASCKIGAPTPRAETATVNLDFPPRTEGAFYFFDPLKPIYQTRFICKQVIPDRTARTGHPLAEAWECCVRRIVARSSSRRGRVGASRVSKQRKLLPGAQCVERRRPMGISVLVERRRRIERRQDRGQSARRLAGLPAPAIETIGVYAATKKSVRAISEALRREQVRSCGLLRLIQM